jgi:hypothetical protein
MENIIQFRLRAAGGGAGSPGSLYQGEPAYNEDSDILYLGTGTGGGATVKVVGGLGAFMSLTTTQTASGNKTFSGTVEFTGTVQGTAFNTAVRLNRIDQMAAAGAAVSMGGFKIQNLADPTSAQDAATKAYVDATAVGLDVKPSVRLATAAALPAHGRVGNVLTASANGALTVDGVAAVAGNRILVKSEGSGTHLENGIYDVTAAGDGSNPWVLTRSSDADASSEVTLGMFVFVEAGTAGTATGWVLSASSATPIVLNTSTITFTQFSGPGTYLAGTGLSLTGSTFAINDAELLALAGLTSAADKLPYFTGSGTASLADLTSVARTLLAQTTQANMRTTGLGLGTIATQAASSVAITGGAIDGTAIGGTTPGTGAFTTLSANAGLRALTTTALSGISGGTSSINFGATSSSSTAAVCGEWVHGGGTADKRIIRTTWSTGEIEVARYADDRSSGVYISRTIFDASGVTEHNWYCGGSSTPVLKATSTGINGTVIGATTAAAGTFTTLTATTLQGAIINGGTF